LSHFFLIIHHLHLLLPLHHLHLHNHPRESSSDGEKRLNQQLSEQVAELECRLEEPGSSPSSSSSFFFSSSSSSSASSSHSLRGLSQSPEKTVLFVWKENKLFIQKERIPWQDLAKGQRRKIAKEYQEKKKALGSLRLVFWWRERYDGAGASSGVGGVPTHTRHRMGLRRARWVGGLFGSDIFFFGFFFLVFFFFFFWFFWFFWFLVLVLGFLNQEQENTARSDEFYSHVKIY
jgi:hypothetical protein